VVELIFQYPNPRIDLLKLEVGRIDEESV
jgi:hypothetical protein